MYFWKTAWFMQCVTHSFIIQQECVHRGYGQTMAYSFVQGPCRTACCIVCMHCPHSLCMNFNTHMIRITQNGKCVAVENDPRTTLILAKAHSFSSLPCLPTISATCSELGTGTHSVILLLLRPLSSYVVEDPSSSLWTCCSPSIDKFKAICCKVCSWFSKPISSVCTRSMVGKSVLGMTGNIY